MAGRFDFAPLTHVAVEEAPQEKQAMNMNGWDFNAKPSEPYRRRFRITLSGMRWMIAGERLDLDRDPQHNAGRLLEFYRDNRTWDHFTYAHEYLGEIQVRFAEPVNIPKAIPNSDGLIPDFDLTLIHHNPGYNS